MVTTEELYMLIGQNAVAIYELRKINQELANELNEARKANNPGLDRLREFNDRVANFTKQAESSESADKSISGPAEPAERF